MMHASKNRHTFSFVKECLLKKLTNKRPDRDDGFEDYLKKYYF